MLTEHLYTVIHQNEVRKARKLAELTHKLELEDDVMVDAAAETVPVPLCLVMPMNQLTMSHHAPTSPLVTAAGKHNEEVPLPTDDAVSNTRQTDEPQQQHVDSSSKQEAAVSPQTQTVDAADSVTIADSSSAIPSTDAAGATE